VKHKTFEKREKDKRIIELWYNSKTYDQIAQEVHASPNYISAVTKKEIIRVEKEEREKENARALNLFSQGKIPLEVCKKLAISAEEAFSLHNAYLELTNRSKLVEMNEELGGNLPSLIDLYETMKDAGMPTEDIVELSKHYYTIPHARKNLEMLLDEVKSQEDKREEYISNWIELKRHNMDLNNQNRDQKDRNRELENKNRELENKNRELENKNRELENKNRELENKNRELRKENLQLENSKVSLERSLAGPIRDPTKITSVVPCFSEAKLDEKNAKDYPNCTQERSDFYVLSPLQKILDNCFCPKEAKLPVIDSEGVKDCSTSIASSPSSTESSRVNNSLNKPHDSMDSI
jgi:hypothetical protein